MKRYMLVILVILLTFSLASCSKDYVTENDVEDIINSLLPEDKVRTTYDLDSFQDEVLDMLDAKRSGIVGVIAKTPEGNASGSGVIYKKEGDFYYVVTNFHVLLNFLSIKIVTKDGELNYHENIEYIGSDQTTDLAVLKFESELDLPVIEFADSYDTRIGEFIFAIGNPSSLEYFGTVTMGVISGDMSFFTDGDVGGFDSALIQHDAAISEGHSGGALLDINGNLVGINNIQILYGYVGSINFAIPVNTVKRIILDLEDDGYVSLPYVGINAALTSLCIEAEGVCVMVDPDGNGFDAGLENLDDIIGYKVGDMDYFKLIETEDQLLEVILNSSVGDTLQFKYIRDGIEYTSLEVILEERP